MADKITEKIAAIRVRGKTGIEIGIKTTLELLSLYRRNYCVILSKSSQSEGMLKKAKDYITWGEIDEETYKALIEKRGEEFKGRETDKRKKFSYRKFFLHNNKKLKKYFRLNSPRKGHGKMGLKASFKNNGALGYRGDKINELIMRMI